MEARTDRGNECVGEWMGEYVSGWVSVVVDKCTAT